MSILPFTEAWWWAHGELTVPDAEQRAIREMTDADVTALGKFVLDLSSYEDAMVNFRRIPDSRRDLFLPCP